MRKSSSDSKARKGAQLLAASRAGVATVLLGTGWLSLLPAPPTALGEQIPGSSDIPVLKPKPTPKSAPTTSTKPVLKPPASTTAPLTKPKLRPTPAPTPVPKPRPTAVPTAGLPPVSWPALGNFEFEIAQADSSGKLAERRKGRAQYFTEEIADGLLLELVAIPGGAFQMGSAEREEKRGSDEGPQLPVVKVPPFYLGRFEVTQAQWRVVARWPKESLELEGEPSANKGLNRPVERVLWEEAMEFCARLARRTGRNYRLPSEAEWEYACRAGSLTPFAFGERLTPELANYGNYPGGPALRAAYGNGTTPVGYFGVANAFGLSDMHGNVWEWCLDVYHASYQGAPTDGSPWDSNLSGERVRRGGAWGDLDYLTRSAQRGWRNTSLKSAGRGFRVVMSTPLSETKTNR